MKEMLKLSDSLVFYWKQGHLICDDYLNHLQKSINEDVFPILNWFSEWRGIDTLKELSEKVKIPINQLVPLIQTLINHKILVTSSSKDSEEKFLHLWNKWGISARFFHFNTRILKDEPFLKVLDDTERLKQKKQSFPPPPIYKIQQNAPRFSLPLPSSLNSRSFQDVLLNRQTIRTYDPNESVSLDTLSNLLFFSFGATACILDHGMGHALLKTSPSGGSRHPIEIYLALFNVNGIESGIYHYSVMNHELELISYIDPEKDRDRISKICGQQPHVGLGAITIFFTAMVERTLWKYDAPRAYRAIMIDLGALIQTFYLVSGSLGLGAYFTAAITDEAIEHELQIDFLEEIVVGVAGCGALTKEIMELGLGGRFVREDVL